MSMQDLKNAFLLIKENFEEEECTFSGKKEEKLIDLAENILDIHFPNTYKEFIREVGFGGSGSILISGIRTNNLEEVKETGVVWKNLNKRLSFNQPVHLVEIENFGEGTTYCLDTSQMNKDGECPVVAWPIDGYDSTPVLEIVAPDFGKFFLDMVEQEIAYKKQTSQ